MSQLRGHRAPARNEKQCSRGSSSVRAAGDATEGVKTEEQGKSRTKIPRALRYELERALVGLCDVWFSEIKPHLVKNNIKLHVNHRPPTAGGDHEASPAGAPGCRHLDPGAAPDRRRLASANCVDYYTTRRTASIAQSRRRLSRSHPRQQPAPALKNYIECPTKKRGRRRRRPLQSPSPPDLRSPSPSRTYSLTRDLGSRPTRRATTNKRTKARSKKRSFKVDTSTQTAVTLIMPKPTNSKLVISLLPNAAECEVPLKHDRAKKYSRISPNPRPIQRTKSLLSPTMKTPNDDTQRLFKRQLCPSRTSQNPDQMTPILNIIEMQKNVREISRSADSKPRRPAWQSWPYPESNEVEPRYTETQERPRQEDSSSEIPMTPKVRKFRRGRKVRNPGRSDQRVRSLWSCQGLKEAEPRYIESQEKNNRRHKYSGTQILTAPKIGTQHEARKIGNPSFTAGVQSPWRFRGSNEAEARYIETQVKSKRRQEDSGGDIPVTPKVRTHHEVRKISNPISSHHRGRSLWNICGSNEAEPRYIEPQKKSNRRLKSSGTQISAAPKMALQREARKGGDPLFSETLVDVIGKIYEKRENVIYSSDDEDKQSNLNLVMQVLDENIYKKKPWR